MTVNFVTFLSRYVSALTTPARLSPVEFHYPLLPPQVPTFQITSPNTSHALSLPPAAAAYHRDEDQPLLRCPDVCMSEPAVQSVGQQGGQRRNQRMIQQKSVLKFEQI